MVALEFLEVHGPGLGRPYVDSIRSSEHSNMKELRPVNVDGATLRILFAFDPVRRAILLVGGDKTNRWREWYRIAVPAADALFTQHLENLAEERAASRPSPPAPRRTGRPRRGRR